LSAEIVQQLDKTDGPAQGRKGTTMVKNIEDMQKAGKDSVDASMQSLSAMSKAFQAIATETADYARKSFEQSSVATEKLVAAKSFDKVLEIQTNYAKNAYEGFVAQATKIGQLYADLAQEAYRPFESQWAKAR
jgi:hypothetical protein